MIGVVGRRDGARSAEPARSATISSTDEWPRGRSTRTVSRTSPPSPTMAAASESTAMSRARTTAPSGFSADERRRASRACPSGDGRLLRHEARGDELADQRRGSRCG